MARFTDKVVVITGAGSGIGRATSIAFAKEGAKVVCADKNESVHETAQLILKSDSAAIAQEMDASSEAQVKALMELAVETYGKIDVVFANAGISGGLTPLMEQTEEDWLAILGVNLIGVAMAIKYAAPNMVENGDGAIICTASVAGLRSGAGGSAYSASKAGVINLVQNAAQQLSGSGVRVNAVCPGLIETGMTKFFYDKAREKGRIEKIGQINPLRRGGEPEELANAVLFLASDDASYVNGHALVVDGGLSSSLPVNRQDFGRVAS